MGGLWLVGGLWVVGCGWLVLFLFFPKHMFLGLLFYVVRWPGVRHAGIDGSRGVPATGDDVDDSGYTTSRRWFSS